MRLCGCVYECPQTYNTLLIIKITLEEKLNKKGLNRLEGNVMQIEQKKNKKKTKILN